MQHVKHHKARDLGKKIERKVSHEYHTAKKYVKKNPLTYALVGILSVGLLLVGGFMIWFSTLNLPSLDAFDEKTIASSTKIYDRTGEIVLFNLHQNMRRTIVPSSEISPLVKSSVVAIEDADFYNHHGVNPKAILRAVFKNALPGGNLQGGSTLTQQVVKQLLLTPDRNITRKIKEIFLAIKLEQRLSKDEILTMYLNIAPYGGTTYGVEEASKSFFGKDANNITLAEAAYLAAIPNAPTFYSPYGNNKKRLDERKNYVLERMKDLGFITPQEFEDAKNEVVVFRPQKDSNAKSLHFVEYIRSYLEEKYGKDVVENGGLKVISTLDYDLQSKAEEYIKKYALENEQLYKASNSALVAVDPKTGQILSMVGSRDYSDPLIDGNYNVATARRQPGSAFKPFVYATAFKQGYLPETVLFDVPTQFSASCSSLDFTTHDPCYAPNNYDNKFLGPINLRNALGQSRNVPSVKLLYLAGVENSLKTAKEMGITTLGTSDRYGLTLVLGGGEVSLLEMTSAYGTFATNGVFKKETGILKIEDKDGVILEEYKDIPGTQVLDPKVTTMINSILSDNEARTPLFGANSFFYFPSRDVAGKTGTTNDNRDAWVLGYTPNLAVGVWSGNNDNTPMLKGSSISGKAWRAFMDEALKKLPTETFNPYIHESSFDEIKPVLRGVWQGGESFTIDTVSNKLATDLTPQETRKEIPSGPLHDILYFINKNNPRGPNPENPSRDSQYSHWETALQNWIGSHPLNISNNTPRPEETDDVHTEEHKPIIKITSPSSESIIANNNFTAGISVEYSYTPIKKVDYFVNGSFIGTSSESPFNYTFIPSDNQIQGNELILKAITIDNVYNKNEATKTYILH